MQWRKADRIEDGGRGCTRIGERSLRRWHEGTGSFSSVPSEQTTLIHGQSVGRCHDPGGSVIDLDAFHSREAIEPDDPATFYRLIRNAVAITIATGAECVDELKFDDEPINADMLLDQILKHIETAVRDSMWQCGK